MDSKTAWKALVGLLICAVTYPIWGPLFDGLWKVMTTLESVGPQSGPFADEADTVLSAGKLSLTLIELAMMLEPLFYIGVLAVFVYGLFEALSSPGGR